MIVNIGPMQFGKEKPANEMKFSDTVVNIIYHEDSPTPVEVNIPAGTKKIRSHVLYDAWPEGGYNVTIPDGCMEIQSGAFANTVIKSISIPPTVSESMIAEDAFADADVNIIKLNRPKNSKYSASSEPYKGCTTDGLTVVYTDGDMFYNCTGNLT